MTTCQGCCVHPCVCDLEPPRTTVLNALRTALSTLGRLAPLGSPENTGQRYRIELERDAAYRTDVIVVSSRFDHNGQRPEVYAKEEVPDILSEDSDQHEAMVLAAAMRLLVAVAGTTALVRAGVIKWTGAPIDALEEQAIASDAATLQQHARIVPTAYGEALHLPYLAESVVCAPRVTTDPMASIRARIASLLGCLPGEITMWQKRDAETQATTYHLAVEPQWYYRIHLSERPGEDRTREAYDELADRLDRKRRREHNLPSRNPGASRVARALREAAVDPLENMIVPSEGPSMTSEQWSASLRAKLAASEVLRGPTIACQGDWDDE